MISLLISLDLHGSLRVLGVCVCTQSLLQPLQQPGTKCGAFVFLLLIAELLSRIQARGKKTHTDICPLGMQRYTGPTVRYVLRFLCHGYGTVRYL